MSELIRARIDPGWASRVASEGFRIFGFNRDNAKTIRADRDVFIEQLGGLVARFVGRDYSYGEALGIAARKHVVNLAFDQPGKLTDTVWLLEAASAQIPHLEIVEQLRQRLAQTDRCGPNETWVIPTSALDLDVGNVPIVGGVNSVAPY